MKFNKKIISVLLLVTFTMIGGLTLSATEMQYGNKNNQIGTGSMHRQNAQNKNGFGVKNGEGKRCQEMNSLTDSEQGQCGLNRKAKFNN